MFKNMGGNVPGGNYLDGNYPGGVGGGVTMAEFDRWEFSVRGGGWQPFSFFYKALRLFVCFYP